MDTRALTALAGLAVGLAISVAAWVLWGTLLLFVLLPFVPLFALRGRSVSGPSRVCPVCGYRTRELDHEYCPKDGHRLESSE